MLAVGVVASARNFGGTALLADFLQRLASAAELIFHLADAIASAVPFLFQFAVANFEAQFFATQSFEL